MARINYSLKVGTTTASNMISPVLLIKDGIYYEIVLDWILSKGEERWAEKNLWGTPQYLNVLEHKVYPITLTYLLTIKNGETLIANLNELPLL